MCRVHHSCQLLILPRQQLRVLGASHAVMAQQGDVPGCNTHVLPAKAKFIFEGQCCVVVAEAVCM